MARRRKRKKKQGGSRRPPEAPKPTAGAPDESASGRSARPWRGMALALTGLAALGALLWIWTSRTSLPEPGRWNVVVVTADTLRADKLGAYGASAPETPHLDELARTGILFENAFTTAPVTLPAHASIFTGTYPIFHGVRENGGRPLSEEHTTLAETLAREGYRTGAFVGAFVLESRWGLAQGFDRYGDAIAEGAERRGGEVLDEALAWMDGVAGEPFFSWIHLFDPHVPYDPPEPERSRYGPTLEGLYDGEVAYVDALFGRLSDWLEARGLEESTLVVFVGDHGESLGEHGELTHGFFVYGATMRVPLLMRAPGLPEGARVDAPVRVVDLAPTVLELLGIEAPAEIQGESLVALAAGGGEGEERPIYGESYAPRHYGWSELESLRTGEYHFVDAPRPELYDVVEDPGERENLASTRAATLRELRERLESLREELAGDDAGEPQAAGSLADPETLEKLAALGYLGSGAVPRAPSGEELPDPKDKIQVFNRIREAAAAIDAFDLDASVRLLEGVIAHDPDIVEAHNLLGKAHARRGDTGAAIASFRRALERDPSYFPAVFGLAEAYRAEGRLDDAVAGLEHLLELEPDSIPAATLLARAHLDAGRPHDALAALERVEAPTLTAEALVGTGRIDEAERLVATTLSEDPEAPGAHYLRGVIQGKKGDVAGAIQSFEREIAVSPRDHRARFELAKLLRQQGRNAEAIEHLERAVEASPGFAVGHLYLADALLEAGALERAVEHAREGLALGREPARAPRGHFILADAYGRHGREEDARREMEIGARLSKSAGGPPR